MACNLKKILGIKLKEQQQEELRGTTDTVKGKLKAIVMDK